MKRNFFLYFLAALFLQTSPSIQAYEGFSLAKKKMYKDVYSNSGKTFYANCNFFRKKVDLDSCYLSNSFSKKESSRSLRTEAEHVIPSSWMYRSNGEFRVCYKQAKALGENKRDYCVKNDSEFKKAHNDLVNLRPAVGAINLIRLNKPFSENLSGKNKRTFNGDGKSVTITSRIIIPPKSIRGDIARIAFYMYKSYGVKITDRQKSLFLKWNKEDPVSEEERQLNKRIVKAQGWGNSFVK